VGLSSPSVTVGQDSSLDACLAAMEENRVRRVVVVDELGRCCGIVSQADIALRGPKRATAEVVREVSQPMPSASTVAGRPAFETEH
jgi:CBS-domain-containing membrane protein